MVKTNKWVEFLKDYAENNDINYQQAMKDPKAKTLYTNHYKNKKVEDVGFSDWMKSLKPTKKAIRKEKGNGLTDAINFITGDFGYSQNCKDILNKFGDIRITSAEVIRKPIEKLWNSILSSISKNFKSELKKQSYDELYHLCIIFTLASGKKIMVEKNATIQMTVNPSRIKNSESMIINSFPDITINQILKASLKKLGSSTFFRYSAQKNNCQHFIYNLLKNSDIITSELEQFIMQSVDKLFTPTLTKFSRNVTDLGGFATMLTDN